MNKIISLITLLVIVSCETSVKLNVETTSKINKQDSTVIKSIYNYELEKGHSYEWLNDLCTNIGARLSGSKEAAEAVNWGKAELDKIGLDSVWLQPVMVPHWVRGEKEVAYINLNGKRINIPICALGGSVATSINGLSAEVIEVKSTAEVDSLGLKVKGKIVFYNRPMKVTKISTGSAYGGAVNQRYSGAKVAAKYGALGTIVRSMNLRLDDYPHTGVMSYGDTKEENKIPTAAISTNGAELLSKLIADGLNPSFYFKQNCKTLPDVESYNVVGELKGSEFPKEIIVVGGHLDSWDLSQGAHDDGAGVVQSMEVLRLFKKLKIKPKRTIRVVLFMNEENGSKGGKKYLELTELNKEKHIVALESDAGGFTPRGFGFACNDKNYQNVLKWKPLFEPYLIHQFVRGGGGADINPLKKEDNVLIGLKPDSQRYFDYHHTSIDNMDMVNKRELELGAATMTSLIYLYDKYGLN